MNIFDKVFGNKKPNTIEVSCGKDKFDIDFTPGSIEDGTITVGELRSQCTYITNTPAEYIRLLYRGKNLTNDTVKLSAVGMKSGSKVLCMAGKPAASQSKPDVRDVRTDGKTPSTQKVVLTPVQQLSDLLNDIRKDLEPPVKAFVTNVPSQEKEKKDTHDRLAELLLQKLFALDGITCKDDALDAEREDLRSKRKEAVKYTQGLLDSVDDIVRKDVLQAELQENQP